MYDIRELEEVAPCGCNKRLEYGEYSRGKQIKERERRRQNTTKQTHSQVWSLGPLPLLLLLSHAFVFNTRVIGYFYIYQLVVLKFSHC